MSPYVETLREELVAAAAREQARRAPRLQRPGPRLALAAGAAVAMLVIVVLAASGGLRSEPHNAGRPAARPPAQDRPLFGGSLERGVRYRTRDFVPAISFVPGDGRWFVYSATHEHGLALQRRHVPSATQPEQPPSAFLDFSHVTQVYEPGIGRATSSLRAAPADLYAWLRRHPDLVVGPSRSVTVDGVPADSFPIRVAFTRPAHSDPYCRSAFLRTCTLIAPGLSFFDDMRVRMIVVRTEPDPLIITLTGYTEKDLQEVDRAAGPLLESLRIGVR